MSNYNTQTVTGDTPPEGKVPFRAHYIGTGVVALLFLGLTYAWSIFRTPLQGMFPDWTASNLSFGFTLLMSFFFIGSFLTGRIANKVNPRIVFASTALLMFVGFMAAGTIHADDSTGSLIKVYIGYCACCGISAGSAHNMILGMMSKWYPDKQGLAAGIVLTAYGLGTVVLGGIIKGLMNSYGIPTTYRILAVAGLVVLGGTALIMHNPPAGSVFPAPKQKLANLSGVKDLTPGQVLKTTAFWLYIIWSILKSIAGVLVVNSAATIAEYYGAAAVVGLIVSITNASSRFIFGTSLDKLGFKKTTVLNNLVMLGAGACMLAGGLTKSIVLIVVGILLTGAGFGSTPAISAVYFRKSWGSKNYQANYSLAVASLMVASIIGPLLSGYLQDQTAPGGDPYISTFVVMAIVCVLSVLAGTLCAKKSSI